MNSWKNQLENSLKESGFSIKEISDQTKVPARYIQAIIIGDFESLPPEIFAKSQIDRLCKFLKIETKDILADYENFLSPPEEPLGQKEEGRKDLYLKSFLAFFNFFKSKQYLYILGGMILSIFSLSIFFITQSYQDINNKENISAITKMKVDTFEPISYVDSSSEFTENYSEKDTSLSIKQEKENSITETVDIIRNIEIIIEGESWIVVFDKYGRLLYELMQTGSYEFTGVPPLRFKIGYAPATNLFIDGKKIIFSRAIKGSTNYAHFWLNEENKVESIRD